MEFEIYYQGPFEIEETKAKDHVIIKGCLLSEGWTGNGHYYSFAEIKQIAKDLVGKPVRYGATAIGKHIKKVKHVIGQVLETKLDKTKKRIIGRVKVWNTATFPRIVETIRFYGSGMGFSIGGEAKALAPILRNGLPVLIKTGHGIMAKVIGMMVKHLQIIPPNVPRGQETAKILNVEEALQKIELVPIQETLMVNPEIRIEISYPKGSFKGVVIG